MGLGSGGFSMAGWRRRSTVLAACSAVGEQASVDKGHRRVSDLCWECLQEPCFRSRRGAAPIEARTAWPQRSEQQFFQSLGEALDDDQAGKWLIEGGTNL
jgi:hypothetical protein